MFIIIRNNNCDVQMNIIEDLKQKRKVKYLKININVIIIINK